MRARGRKILCQLATQKTMSLAARSQKLFRKINREANQPARQQPSW
jgi:hypothetical protein